MSKKNIDEVMAIVEGAGLHLIQYNDAKNIIVVDDQGYKYAKALQNIKNEMESKRARKISKTFLQKNPFALDNLKLYVEKKSGGTFHIVSDEYVNAKTPIQCVCDIHKSMGVQYTTPDKLVNGKSGYLCKYCGRMHSQDWKRIRPEVIISHCQAKGSSVVDIRTENAKTVVDYVCDTHSDMGVQTSTWEHLKSYKHCCRYCSGRGVDTEMYRKLVAEVNPHLVILNEYEGYESRIWALCDVCGHIWETRAGQLMSKRRHRGCPQCGAAKRTAARTYTKAEFEEQLRLRRPDCTLHGEYSGSHKKVTVRCNMCHSLFNGLACNILNGTVTCQSCRERWPTQHRIRNIIISWGIDLIPEYRYADCVYKRQLPFDAYLPEYNVLIEYDGEQHYYPVEYFKAGHPSAEEAFVDRQIKDNIKTEYCKNNGIPLIRIPYWERNNLENSLLSEFQKLGININTQARQTDRLAQ